MSLGINIDTVSMSCFNKVVVFTIVEIYNDDDSRSINHHGSSRKVQKNGFLPKQTNVRDIAKFFGKSHKTHHESNFIYI